MSDDQITIKPTEPLRFDIVNLLRDEPVQRQTILTHAIHNAVEDAVLEALSAERERCAKIVERMEPIIRPGERHSDTKDTLRAAATLIRLGV
jgi:hypothetical protein